MDDTFSGLDGETERSIFDNLFGPKGLICQLKTTVILVSNSGRFSLLFDDEASDIEIAQYFQSADHVVVLGNRGIVDQGNWQSIKIKAASIAKFDSGHRARDNTLVSASFEKLGAQIRAKDEAEMDLARQSGDSALYGAFLLFQLRKRS